MNRSIIAVVSTIAMLGLVVGSAQAQVTPADASCRAAIQKSASKLGATAMKSIDTCIKKMQLAGSPATNCNDWTVADTGKITAAAGKVSSGISVKCLSLPANIPASVRQCPSPGDAADAGGATSAVDDLTELSDCEASINTDTITTLRNEILRLRPRAAQVGTDPTLVKCANAIGKNATKLWKTVAKVRGKCQTQNDKIPGAYDYFTCSSFDDGTIAGAALKLQAGVSKACGPATGLTPDDLSLLGSCASDDVGIGNCVAEAVTKNASGATAVAFELTGVCPSSMRVVLNGNSSSDLDLGWGGLGHDLDLQDGAVSRMNVTGCSSDCSSCTLTASCAEGNCRCSNDPTILCSTPFVAGGPCGAGTCYVHDGPPLAQSAGGAPICVVNTIRTAFSGAFDAGTGETTIPLQRISQVFSGLSQQKPCPTCSGATIGAGGTCSGGARNGLACNTHAVNTSYGNSSYDCPPSLAANISGSGHKINPTLTTGAVSMFAFDTCDSPYGALSCFCGACSLDPTRACFVDSDCLGLGTCNNAGGPARQPNACSDQTCNNVGGEGVCLAGPIDAFCDGLTRSNGEPYMKCFNNADCIAADPLAGECTVTKSRSCFLNPIAASGFAGTEAGELVAGFCMGPSASGSVNAAFGLPGPGRMRLDVDYTPLCADGSTEYELGGANCP